MLTQRKDNVVNLHKQERQPITMTIDEMDTFAGRRRISSLLRTWIRAKKGRTYYQFGRKVGLSSTTISRFASDETKWARDHTIRMIMKGLGFRAITYHPADMIEED